MIEGILHQVFERTVLYYSMSMELILTNDQESFIINY